MEYRCTVAGCRCICPLAANCWFNIIGHSNSLTNRTTYISAMIGRFPCSLYRIGLRTVTRHCGIYKCHCWIRVTRISCFRSSKCCSIRAAHCFIRALSAKHWCVIVTYFYRLAYRSRYVAAGIGCPPSPFQVECRRTIARGSCIYKCYYRCGITVISCFWRGKLRSRNTVNNHISSLPA